MRQRQYEHRREARAETVSDIELPVRVNVGRDFLVRVDQHGSALTLATSRIDAMEKRLGALERPIASVASAPSLPAAATIQENHDVLVS